MSSHVVSYALRFGTWPKTPTPSHVSIFLWMECIRTGSAQRQVPSVAVQIGTGPGLVSTFDSKQERQSSKLPPPRQRRAFAPGRRSVGLRASRNAEQAATRAAASAPDAPSLPLSGTPPELSRRHARLPRRQVPLVHLLLRLLGQYRAHLLDSSPLTMGDLTRCEDSTLN